MSNKVHVIGVGMTKFDKPGTKEGDYPDWAKEAGEKALADAGIPYARSSRRTPATSTATRPTGQRAVYELGLTGIPVLNVNNNCSTGSSALFLARQAVKGGLIDCALAIGFEKMELGSLGMKYTDRTPAMDKHMMRMFEIRDPEQSPSRRRCSATPGATTWRSTAQSPSTTRGSGGRTTSTRSTTRTRSSRPSTRSRRSRTRG